jgi:hypothetical protein
MKKLALFLSFLFVISCTKDPIIYTLTTSANPADGGTVSPSTQQYGEGKTATITAAASSEYVFQSWSGATGSTNSTSVVMNSDKSVTANFVKKKYALTTTVEGEGTVSEKVIKAGAATDYNSGTIVELTAVPSGEWQFIEWKGDLTGSENPKEITIDKAKNVTAVFVEIQYPISDLNNYSTINKKTSWYQTNKSFDELHTINGTKYHVFEKFGENDFRPVTGGWNESKVECCYYMASLGSYLFTDLNGDGVKDLWAYLYKMNWPKNQNGLHLFVDNYSSDNYDVQIGLHDGRKQVLSDFNNDGNKEIMLFSHGYDRDPWPGDSLAIFDVSNKKYRYLSDDIGFFHGGATGDINKDGFEDIIAYSGFSAIIPVHPLYYENDGSGSFELKNEIFLNFTDADNYYTVELFDINEDGFLDLFLGTRGALVVIKNENGIFDRNNGINIQTDQNLEVMDIDFFDFNEDGINDILVMNNKTGYNGYSLNLYRFSFENNGEITSNYFDITEHSGSNSWVKWLHLFDSDNDGDLDIVGDGLFGDLVDKQVVWRNESGKFKRYQY